MKRMKPEIIMMPGSVDVRAVKDHASNFQFHASANMWHIQIRRPDDGFWMDVQWMDAYGVELIFGIKDMPRYKFGKKGLIKVRK